jgi:serine/threonine-protein kinase
MNRERWRHLKEIVADAMEKDSPAARTALLMRECAGDLNLLSEAESFLEGVETTTSGGGDRWEECAEVARAARRRERALAPGQRIGAYVILRELGHGGMATVYLGARRRILRKGGSNQGIEARQRSTAS